MTYKFIEIPHFVKSEAYEGTIEKSVLLLSKEPSLLAIYQLGNVNHPGISDIDLYAVFQDGATCSLKPETYFDDTDSYLITHSIAGACEQDFLTSLKYTFWDNMHCIQGTDLLTKQGPSLTTENDQQLKIQTALEFLYKHYIDLSCQLNYGVVKLRTALQHIKGIRYDLDFLNLNQSPLKEYIDQHLNVLDHWFEQEFSAKSFSKWLKDYHNELEALLFKLKVDQTLFLPNVRQFQFGRNVQVTKANRLSFNKKGVFLSPVLIGYRKKLFNLHQRFNSFECNLPYENFKKGDFLEQRFEFFKRSKAYNKRHLPHFTAFFPSLNHQLI